MQIYRCEYADTPAWPNTQSLHGSLGEVLNINAPQRRQELSVFDTSGIFSDMQKAMETQNVSWSSIFAR